MPKCCICDYKIKTVAKDPKKRILLDRRDTMSFQLSDRWICGGCRDELWEMLHT